MSTNTSKLKLFKWNPNTDGAEQFNIDTALNENWDKVDKFATDSQVTLDKVTNDIVPNLTTTKYADMALQAGTQTLTAVKKQAAFNFTGATGRMLLNILGQEGNAESVRGWSTTGGTIAVDTTTKVYGNSSLKFTLNDVAGQVVRSIPVTAGERYIIIAELRVNTASSARVTVSAVGTGSSVSTGSGYVRSFMRFLATANTHNVGISISGASGNTVNIDGIRVYQVSQAVYTSAGTMSYSELGNAFPYTEGLAGVRNPYAIRWDSADKKEIRSMLAFQTELLADPVSGANPDSLSVSADGQYVRTSIWRKVSLTGDMSYTLLANRTGYKVIEYGGDAVAGGVANSQTATKFDRSILGTYTYGVTDNVADKTSYSGSALPFTVLNSDSGWSDSYNPSSDEIKAFILGWKMYDASTNAGDGMGTYGRTDGANKRWTPLASFDGTGYNGNVSAVPGARPELVIPGGYRISRTVVPYEIMYKLADSSVSAVPFEGQLSMIEGDNVVEVGSGIILREPARPVLRTNYDFNIAGIFFKNRADRILQLYADTMPFYKWTAIAGDVNGAAASVPVVEFQTDKPYKVSYLIADKYPTVPFTGNLPDNEKTLFQDLVTDMQQMTALLSAVANTKADKESALWLFPTVLNGWVPANSEERIRYRKTSTGAVEIQGLITGGSTAGWTRLFQLASGYRPGRSLHFPVYYMDGSTVKIMNIDIGSDGWIAIGGSGLTSNTILAMTIPPFSAER